MGDSYDPAVLHTAYARLKADGDEKGAAKVRAMATTVAPPKVFADAPPSHAPLTPPPDDDQPWANNHAQNKAAFEKAIDANPLDSHTHLIYADYLQDHAESPEEQHEAEFRRGMGTWIGNGGLKKDPDQPRVSRPWGFRLNLADERAALNQHRQNPNVYLPKGVEMYSGNLMPFNREEENAEGGQVGLPHTQGTIDMDTGDARWHEYRHLENALRNSYRPLLDYRVAQQKRKFEQEYKDHQKRLRAERRNRPAGG